MSEGRTEYSGVLMTEEQGKAYDEFVDFMAQLYRDYAYLLDEEEGQN